MSKIIIKHVHFLFLHVMLVKVWKYLSKLGLVNVPSKTMGLVKFFDQIAWVLQLSYFFDSYKQQAAASPSLNFFIHKVVSES